MEWKEGLGRGPGIAETETHLGNWEAAGVLGLAGWGAQPTMSPSFFSLRATEAIGGAPWNDSSSCLMEHGLLGGQVLETAPGRGRAIGQAQREAAGFRVIWSKINVARVNLQWGARVRAGSRDPELLACRTGLA